MGNPLGSRCSVCADPCADAINYKMLNGVGIDTLAKVFPSVSRDSLKRHKHSGHHQRSVTTLAAALPADRAASLAASTAKRADALVAEAWKILDDAGTEFQAARDRNDSSAVVKLLGMRLNAVRLLGDFAGAFPKAGTNIDARSVTINALGDLTRDELRALVAGSDDAQPHE
jgi:hypothetical protein